MDEKKKEITEVKVETYPNSKLYWFGGWVYDFTKIATFFVFFALICHYFFFTIFFVSGISMDKTMKSGDMMIINRIHYRQSSVLRGDIIALYFPGEEEKKFVKRIIGLPGEKIKIINDKVYINDRVFSEPYLKGVPTKPSQEVKLEDNEYFVMGDNREASSDSRVWGPLPRNYIIGKTTYKILNNGEVAKGIKNDLRSIKTSIANFQWIYMVKPNKAE